MPLRLDLDQALARSEAKALALAIAAALSATPPLPARLRAAAPFGLPSVTPRALAAARASLVRRDDARPDVAVLDVNLRGKPVVPVAQRLRKLRIPFVVASANATCDFDGGETLAEADNVGKPIPARRLLDALDRAVTAE